MTLPDILKAYVNNKIINEEITPELLKLCIEQSLQTLLYPVTNNKEYKKYYISWILKQEQFYSIQKELTKLFNDNQIKHIYFKGSVISKLYDDPAVRTRGDIDLYIGLNDFKKAIILLSSNGYIMDNNSDYEHHLCLIKNYRLSLYSRL